MKKVIRKRFSPLEDKLIEDTVKKNINNLQYAFARVSELLEDRTPDAIQQRYYNVIRKRTPLFAHVSRRGMTMNVKNVKRDENGNIPKMPRITTENVLTMFGMLTNGQQKQFRNAIN